MVAGGFHCGLFMVSGMVRFYGVLRVLIRQEVIASHYIVYLTTEHSGKCKIWIFRNRR